MSEHKVQLRGGFSDRNKIAPINTTLQTTELDQRTRNALLNLIRYWIRSEKEESRYDDFSTIRTFYCNLVGQVYGDFLSETLLFTIHQSENQAFEELIFPVISTGSYDEVLTIVEYICNWFKISSQSNFLKRNWNYKYFSRALNEVLEKEFVGYRMVEDRITAITDSVEIKEIEEGLDIQFQGPKSHIQKALGFLADREHKDYKNSIKESISAVESICEIIVGSESATLGKALKALKDKKINIHPALEKAFSSLYGYTSDEGGIRHAEGLFESNVTFEEAKYMLVSCCAFVNYLIAEYGKTQSVNGEQR